MPEETRHSGYESRDLFDDFNRDPDDELPPLELIEEGDVDRIEEGPRGENIPGQNGQNGSDTSSRPARQLRNRNVARSVKGSKSVRSYSVTGFKKNETTGKYSSTTNACKTSSLDSLSTWSKDRDNGLYCSL